MQKSYLQIIEWLGARKIATRHSGWHTPHRKRSSAGGLLSWQEHSRPARHEPRCITHSAVTDSASLPPITSTMTLFTHTWDSLCASADDTAAEVKAKRASSW